MLKFSVRSFGGIEWLNHVDIHLMPTLCCAVEHQRPSRAGQKTALPKCKQVFRAADPTQAVVPGFASLDFDDSAGSRPSDNNDADWLSTELPLAPAPASTWQPPVREVTESTSPALSNEEAERLKSRREYSLLMAGGAACGVIALGILIIGAVTVWRSIQKNADQAAAAAGATTEPAAPTSSGSGNLPTVFGFDETRRALLVDYLVSQGNGKPKAKLTMAMVVNALRKLAADFNVPPSEEFPEPLELLRERVTTRDVPEELLKSEKMPAVFHPMMDEYVAKKLGPAEEDVAILVSA